MRSNRTNVGLKPVAYDICAMSDWSELKSDQCGIETRACMKTTLQALARLKSDQCGIET